MTIEARFERRLGDFHLDVGLELPAHGVTALFGPSGSGKTTILRAMAGLDRIRGGRLTVNGERWQGRLRFLPAHRRAVGCVFQDPSLFPHLDVRGNLEYGARRRARGELARRVGEAAAMLDLQSLLSRRPETLSGGEQRRVAIARALARRPRLLLLDEPLTGLDRARKQEILRCLERVHRELDIPVVLVSHDAEEVARLADFLVLLERGRVRSAGPLAEQLTALDQPLAHDDAAAAVIEARVARQEPRWHLTELQFAGGRLTVPESPLPEGGNARVRIGARDVSLALRAPVDTSILNVLQAKVTELSPDGPGQVLVRLDCGGQPLLARITAKSAERLGLEPGSDVHAQVKSLALLS